VIDRRITFFLGAALVCGLMVPLAPGEFRWVPIATAVTYVVLAILVALESFSAHLGRGVVEDDDEI